MLRLKSSAFEGVQRPFARQCQVIEQGVSDQRDTITAFHLSSHMVDIACWTSKEWCDI